MKSRIATLLVAIGFSAAVQACDDPPTARASIPNIEGEATLAPMNNSPLDAPSALIIRFPNPPSTINPSFSFDVAFDLTPGGDLIVYTVRRIANELVPVKRVGLQTTQAPLELVDKAPVEGWVYDSLVVVPVGMTVLVQTAEQDCVGAIRGTNIHAKLRADSTDVGKKAIYLRVLSNPNCGFRSLNPGTPPD